MNECEFFTFEHSVIFDFECSNVYHPLVKCLKSIFLTAQISIATILWFKLDGRGLLNSVPPLGLHCLGELAVSLLSICALICAWFSVVFDDNFLNYLCH